MFFWLFALVIALVIIVFSVNNRADIPLDLWPTPYEATLPVFLIALVGIFVGFVFGGIVAWFSAGRYRRKIRDLVRRIENDAREMAILRSRVQKLEAADRQASIPPPPADAA